MRYTGSGVAYNIASILGAALTPFAAVWLTKNFGVRFVGIYLSLLSVLTFVALWLSKETKNTNLDTLKNEAASIETAEP